VTPKAPNFAEWLSCCCAAASIYNLSAILDNTLAGISWVLFSSQFRNVSARAHIKKLIALLDTLKGVRFGRVDYLRLKDLKIGEIDVEKIPFTKRWPYRCEEEFRIIWESDTTKLSYEIEIDLQTISKITISQRMPEHIYLTIRDYLRDAFADPE
jgi:hypothetical protein